MPTPTTVFVPKGQGERLRILGSTHINKITPAQTGGAFSAIEIVIPPDCGPPLHSHEEDSEFFYVLEGTLTLSDPAGDIEAGPGDFCYLAAGGHHAFRNNTTSDVRALIVISPGVAAHRFFREVDAALEGRVDPPVVVDIAGRNGIAFA